MSENTLGAAIGTGILAQETGQEVMRLDSSGNFGIGTASPAGSLIYNTTGRYDINTQSRLAIRSDGDINHQVIFHGPGGKEVGRMDFNGEQLEFEGDASEAAKVFTEWCRRTWGDLRAKDKTEVLQQVIDDMLHEASGELYSEDEKVAILTCMQIAQKRKKEHEAPEVAEQYSVNLAKSMQATKEAVAQSVLSAIAPEGKSL